MAFRPFVLSQKEASYLPKNYPSTDSIHAGLIEQPGGVAEVPRRKFLASRSKIVLERTLHPAYALGIGLHCICNAYKQQLERGYEPCH